MKPLRVWARNLRTWDDLDVRIPEGVTAVVGENGAGKSTLVHVIDLALFGSGRELKRALGRGGGAEECEVGVEFEHRADLYRVRRSYSARGAGKSRLDFERLKEVDVTAIGDSEPQHVLGAESLTRETIDATEHELEALLGITRQTFRASSYLAQDEGDAFTSAPPRERKAILLEALGIRLWDRLRERAAAERSEQEHELARLLGVVEGLEGQLAIRGASEAAAASADIDAGRLHLAVEDLEVGMAALREEFGAAQAQAAASQEAHARADAEARRLTDAENVVEALRGRIAVADGREGDRERLEAEANLQPLLEALLAAHAAVEAKETAAFHLDALAAQAAQETQAATEQADAARERTAATERERYALERHGATCPVCAQDLQGPALAAAKAQVLARLRATEAERDNALAHAQAARAREDAAQRGRAARLQERSEALETAEQARGRLPDAAAHNPTVALATAREAAVRLAGLEEVRSTAGRDRAELAAVEERLPALRLAAGSTQQAAQDAPSPEGLAEMRTKGQAAEAQLRELRAALQDADSRLARARGELERLVGIELQVAAQRGELDEVRDRVVVLKLAERAYSRDGIPALILEAAALPQLEAEANRIVGELGRAYRFELRSQRETASGDLREALDIVVHTEAGEAAYEDFSGGERTRLDLALRIALARLLAARRGADIRLLAIDEPSYLDAAGFARLAVVLRGLSQEFESVLVVSHVSELRDAFDQALVVVGGADTGEPSRLEEAAA